MRVVSRVGQRKHLWDETDVRNDGIKTSHFLSDLTKSSVIGISWVRHGPVFSLTTLLMLPHSFLNSSLTSAGATALQIPAPPAPSISGSSLTLSLQPPGGILPWALGSLILLMLMAVLVILLRRKRRRNTSSHPLPIASVPSLESSDGAIYFRLDGLDSAGLIIGRGKHGVDLPIEESVPYADTVSNQHARIYYDNAYGHVIIEDLDSTNGVYINGRRAPRKNLLKDGWVIGLGRLNMTYYDGESDTGPLDG
jgi:hypothetical protein